MLWKTSWFFVATYRSIGVIMDTKRIGIIIAIIAVAAIAGFWYWRSRQAAPPPQTPVVKEEPAGLGAQIFEQAQNPLKGDVPETNPFAADTNPFDADTNPYKDAYKNPFQ